MQVKLISKDTPFWYLMKDDKREVVCSLNDESPGPVELEWSELTKSQQIHVRLGVQFGIISCEGLPSPAEAEAVKVPEKKVLYGKEEYQADKDEMRKELVALLQGGIRQVKAKTVDIEDTKRLGMLLNLERRGKSRKGVLTYLTERLTEAKTKEEEESIRNVLSNPAVSRGQYGAADVFIEDPELAIIEME